MRWSVLIVCCLPAVFPQMSFSSEFEVEVVKGLLEVVVVAGAKVVPVVVLPAEEKEVLANITKCTR